MAKVRIPKRVGGMKIPKKVRRKAKKALKAAESPVVREFAAAALGAAASRAEARTGGNGRGFGATARVSIDGDRLVATIRTAALDGISRFLQGFEEGLRNAAGDRDEEPPIAPEPPLPPEPPEPPESQLAPEPPLAVRAPRPPRPPRAPRPGARER